MCRYICFSPLERHSWLVLAEGLLDTAGDELVEHLKSSFWLVHWNHMAGLEHSEELEILVSLECTSRFRSDSPFLVVLLLEVSFTGPIACIGPYLTSTPITNEVLVT